MKQKTLELKHIFLFIQLLILAACLLICLLCHLPLRDGIAYFAYQLCGIALPGLAIAALTDRFFKDPALMIAFSLTFGLLVQLIVYLITILTGLNKVSLFIDLLIAAFSVFVIRKKKEILNTRCGIIDPVICFILIVFLMVLCFYAVSWHTISPEVYGSTIYNKDFLFWVGNSISFTKGLPVQEFRLYGYTFYYHYFSSILMAIASLSCGIDVVNVSYYFSYLIPCILLVYASYCFLKSLVRNRVLLFAGMVFILLMNGSVSFLPEHLYYCPFCFDYAYALAMLSVTYLIQTYRNDSFTIKDLLISCILIIMGTGFKGPVELVALAAFGTITISLLFERRWKQGLIFGACWLISFLVVYIFLISGIDAPETVNGLEFLGPLKAFDINRWCIEIFNELREIHHFGDNGITRILALCLYIYRSHKAATILMIVSGLAFVYLLMKRKGDAVLFSLMAAAAFGILVTISTHQDGNSQIYFIMASVPFAVLAGLYGLQALNMNKNIAILTVALTALVSFGDFHNFFLVSAKGQVDEAIMIQRGESRLTDERYCFSKEEYELSKWLKANTSGKDLIALDLFEYDGMRKEEMLGVFAERFIWNDGQYSYEGERDRRRNLVNEVMKGKHSALQDLKKEGVIYLIQTLGQYPDKVRIDADIVYEENGFRVYSLSDK